MAKLPVPYSTRLFWDVAPEAIDPDQHAPHIIARVAERGTLDEFKACVAYYGLDRVRQVIETRRGIPDDVREFWRRIWDEDRQTALHFEVLPREITDILRGVKDVLPPGALLCGETAVALYVGHRTPEELEFWTSEHFDVDEVQRLITGNWGNEASIESVKSRDIVVAIHGVKLRILRQGGIVLTPGSALDGVMLADLDTVMAVQLDTLVGRARKKDFVDLFFLCLHRGMGVRDLIELAQHRIPSVNDALVLSRLVDCEVADVEPMPSVRTYCRWEQVRRFFEAGVRVYMQKIGGLTP